MQRPMISRILNRLTNYDGGTIPVVDQCSDDELPSDTNVTETSPVKVKKKKKKKSQQKKVGGHVTQPIGWRAAGEDSLDADWCYRLTVKGRDF